MRQNVTTDYYKNVITDRKLSLKEVEAMLLEVKHLPPDTNFLWSRPSAEACVYYDNGRVLTVSGDITKILQEHFNSKNGICYPLFSSIVKDNWEICFITSEMEYIPGERK